MPLRDLSRGGGVGIVVTTPLRIELAKPVGKAWGGLGKTVNRQGILVHYDASRTDTGAVAWLEDDLRARVSYHYLVLDDGRILQIAPPGTRAWHAGVCKPSRREFTYSDGNNAFYGVAAAATDGERATTAQLESIAQLCRYLFWLEGWDEAETWRITGHDAEAWPRGRKVDPIGDRSQRPENPFRDLPPVLDVAELRSRFLASSWTGIP